MEYWDKSLLEGGKTGGRCSSTRVSSALCRRICLELRSCPNSRGTSMWRSIKLKKAAILVWSETL